VIDGINLLRETDSRHLIREKDLINIIHIFCSELKWITLDTRLRTVLFNVGKWNLDDEGRNRKEVTGSEMGFINTAAVIRTHSAVQCLF
jgi:hypothetical protein